MPLFEVDSWLTGRRGVALPFTDECEPLAAPGFSSRDLFEAAKEIGRERRWNSLEIRGGVADLGGQPSISFFGHELDLSVGAEAVFKGLHSSMQRAIRKAEKSGVEVSFESSLEGVEQYYQLHCLTRDKHGLPPQPFKFFASIHRHLISVGSGFVALAQSQGRPVAGAIFFQHGAHALYKFGASDLQFDALRPNNLVMWRAIQRFAANGAAKLDFGRTSMYNDGLRRYKLNWGARERTISYARWDVQKRAFRQDKDQSSGLQNVFFRRCPLALSRALGQFLYRHIA